MSFVSFNRKVFLPRERIVAVVPVSTLASRKIREVDLYKNKMINASYGKQVRTAIIMDSGHVILIPTRYRMAVRAIWGRRRKGAEEKGKNS